MNLEMDQQNTTNDPYAYLDRATFSAEKFKIEVKNLPKIYGIQELRKLLNKKLQLKSTKIKVPKQNSRYIFVCFKNDEDRIKAMETLHGFQWRGKTLQAVKAKPSPDPLVAKRNLNNPVGDATGNKPTILDAESLEDHLKCTTIPLWNVPYAEQLNMKMEEIRSVLEEYHNSTTVNTNKNNANCDLLPIRTASETAIIGYRNKCSFTIGRDAISNQPMVGFRLGSYVGGTTHVGSVQNLCHISDRMKTVVGCFQTFIRDVVPLPIYDLEVHTGNYRQLLVRSSDTALMVSVGIHPQNLTVETISNLQRDLVRYFTEGDGKEANITSLYYQEIIKRGSGDCSGATTKHLWGTTHITQQLRANLRFNIGPEAFFQVNTAAARILYATIEEFAEPLDGATVLDVCCGTGTIALSLAYRAKHVIGVECVPEAVRDARENANLNAITNCQFYAGKAEDSLMGLLSKMPSDTTTAGPIVAVLDPPRAGLHVKAIQQLRRCERIKRIIYVACNARAALKNFQDLGRPESKTLANAPFIARKAVAVDLFPHTKHCELVVCFERVSAAITAS